MPTHEYLSGLLPRLLPGVVLHQRLPASGQRAVYFSNFQEPALQTHIEWEKCVLKAAEELSPKQIAYLQTEIEILNSLNSKYYPKLHFNDVFTHDPDTEEKLPNRLFITIEEFIESKPLTDCIAEFRDEKKCLELLRRMVLALSELWNHERKIIHRDIKPANVLIRPNGEVVIIDLGIVREEGAEGLTEAWSPFGPCTPGYASPEQARNDKKNISFRSDFFCLGILAYEICTGSNPFTKDVTGRDEVFSRIVNFAPPSLATLGKGSKKFSDVVEKLLAKEPYQRFRTIDSLDKALNECLEALQ